MRTTKLTGIPKSKWSGLGLVVFQLGSLFVLSASFWDWKPYMEWSERETVRMLTDSPWARAQILIRTQFRQWTHSYESGPWNSPCDCRDALTTFPMVATRELPSAYYVRFETAAPIRRAVSRLWFLEDRITREEAEEFAESALFEGYIVVVVTALPKLAQSELDTFCTASLQESTCVLSLENSRRSIPLCQYVSPRQAGTGEAYFIFPRSQDGQRLVTPEERAVSFDCRLNDEARILCGFSLEEMLFEEELEI